MTSRRLAPVLFVLTLFAPVIGSAQVANQPTPAPTVTAESERWYLSGEAIAYSGNLYYPAGAQIHFNANEMVRSGSVLGVPLYSRTTLEPYSIVFVPLAGGMMQPYERRRTGDIAGTAGSAMSSLPTASTPADTSAGIPQAAGAPTGAVGVPAGAAGVPAGTAGVPPGAPGVPTGPQAVSAANVAGSAPGGAAVNPASAPRRAPAPAPRTSPQRRPTRTSIGPKPEGVNSLFVDFRDRRWYPEGAAVRFDRTRMLQIGDRGGFPVYADRDAPEARIYISVGVGRTMVLPYSLRRPQ
ncbi:MAG TPA: hypothetical protein VNJ03_02315 [Vicinamibacterales bacterium]|nr:hypothetical protein [Vicinamibacterales bacterium]